MLLRDGGGFFRRHGRRGIGPAGLIETARPNQGPRPRCAGLPVSQKADQAYAAPTVARNVSQYPLFFVRRSTVFGVLALHRANAGQGDFSIDGKPLL
ncbi:hypothetical protein BOTU111922_23510 [Bordetella tumulicola]